MSVPTTDIGERTLIPELLASLPGSREILDRYGLRGCGGPSGPVESLGFFARAHDVPLAKLIDEIRRASVLPQTPADSIPAASLADTIYRPFFLSGIATVLTLGAVWGAYLLWQIGMQGTFRAAGLHEINAHGHAQIFGWVGLFVMGFAYQAFPRFKHQSLSHPRLALGTLVLLVTGLIARSLAQPLVVDYPWLWWIAVGASVLEVVAIGVFAWLMIRVLFASGKPLAHYDYYILAALGWFVVQAIYEGIYLTATLSASGNELTQLVATWQAPLRDVQIHGFALLMILGVSQRAFHHFYGLPAPSAKWSLIALPLLNVAVIGEAAGLVLMRQMGPVWAGLWFISAIVLAATTIALAANWRIFSPAPDGDRSLKFLRVAYVWLFVSLVMLVLLPAHQAIVTWLAPSSVTAELGFSHAYYGATRHAITVGFVSLMIMGVAAKVVPTLNGVDAKRLSGLWAPYLLMNAGCGLRVGGQILTDFTPGAFPIAGVSGLLEVAGLALWGGHLCRIMAGYACLRPAPASRARPLLATREIDSTDTVAAILESEPRLLGTFLAAGFTQLASPAARNTIARVVTLRQACQRMDVALDSFVAQLNQDRLRFRSLDLPLVQAISAEPGACVSGTVTSRDVTCHAS